MSRKGRTIWWVRTSPRLTTWSFRSPESSSPRKRIFPEVGWIDPTRQEKRVVFPAPLGPMTLKISPGSTSSETESRAGCPPKRLEPDSPQRRGPGTVRLHHRRGASSGQAVHQPLPQPDHAPGLEEHHHDQQPSVDEEVGIPQGRAGQELDLQVAEEDRPQDRTDHRPHPPHDRHEDDAQRQPEVEDVAGADVLEVDRKEAPAQGPPRRGS